MAVVPSAKPATSRLRKAKYAENPKPYIARVKKWQQENVERLNAYRRDYRQRPDRQRADRNGYLRRKYGITIEDFEAMFEAQGGVCTICGKPRSEERTLHIDHDHETGEIRGLLCFRSTTRSATSKTNTNSSKRRLITSIATRNWQSSLALAPKHWLPEHPL
jgi:hypothetical protein